MSMHETFKEEFASSFSSSCPSLSDSGCSSSFCSWDSGCITPPQSVRHASFDSIKFEDMPFCKINNMANYTLSSSVGPDAYEASPSYSHNDVLLSDNKASMGHGLSRYNLLTAFGQDSFGSYQNCHGLPVDPASPMTPDHLASHVSMSFVNPSQTTFVNNFEHHSPVQAFQYHSPVSEYGSHYSFDQSPVQSVSYQMQYRGSPSTPSTPCRAPILRQPTFSTKTSAALQKVLSLPSSAERHERKKAYRMKREASSSDSGDGILRAADKPCPWVGCTRKFKRQEHLKRHEKTHLPSPDTCEETFQCPFCDKRKVFAGERADNLTSHVKLHINGSNRTPKHPGARAWLNERKKKASKEERTPPTRVR